MVQIPAGGTFFDTIQRSFADVPIDAANDNAIATSEFLEAASSLVTLFGMLSCLNLQYSQVLTVESIRRPWICGIHSGQERFAGQHQGPFLINPLTPP